MLFTIPLLQCKVSFEAYVQSLYVAILLTQFFSIGGRYGRANTSFVLSAAPIEHESDVEEVGPKTDKNGTKKRFVCCRFCRFAQFSSHRFLQKEERQ